MRKTNTRRDFIKNAAFGTTAVFVPTLLHAKNSVKGVVQPLSIVSSKGAYINVTNGKADLYIDGKKSSRMWARLSLPGDEAPAKLDQYMDAGIEVYMTDIDTAVSLCWDGVDEFYFDKYESLVRRLVEKNQT